jgi:hypothetical protein
MFALLCSSLLTGLRGRRWRRLGVVRRLGVDHRRRARRAELR